MSLAGMSTLWLSRRASHSLSGNLWIALSETKCAPTARFAALKQARSAHFQVRDRLSDLTPTAAALVRC